MKKILLLSLLVVFVFASTSVYAAEKYALGMGNVALKIDYLNFTDTPDLGDDADIDLEDCFYVGLEGSYAIYPNLYLGLEAGWAGSEDDGTIGETDVEFDMELTYIPIELNLKYVVELDPSWNVAFGAGISYNYLQLDFNELDAEGSDWVFGGQLFADVNYKINKDWFIGINAKYQFTDDIDLEIEDSDIDDIESSVSASNFRVGAHVGLMF